mgnify:CR=1 FL=1
MTGILSIRDLRKTYDDGFEALKGVGHFVAEEVPEETARHLLAHLRLNRAGGKSRG